MGVPVSQMYAVASYIIRQKAAGKKRYPLVLMLEPLFRCNLACAGCGKIQYPARYSPDSTCLPSSVSRPPKNAAPRWSAFPGGEPLLHPQIAEIVEGLIARGKYVYLCTNALILKEKLDLLPPEQIFHDQRSPGRAEEISRSIRMPRRRLRHCRRCHQGSDAARLPRDDQHHAVQRCRRRRASARSSTR